MQTARITLAFLGLGTAAVGLWWYNPALSLVVCGGALALLCLTSFVFGSKRSNPR